jgi:hypothetical protein
MRSRRTLLAVLVILGGCGSESATTPIPSSSATVAPPSPSVAASAAAGGVLVPGPLVSGATYGLPDIGLSVTIPEDGWDATLPNGGDLRIVHSSSSVWITRPQTIVSSDGTARRPWPVEPERAAASIEAVRGITVTSATPLEIAGVEATLLTITASGLGPEAPMFQSGSGEYGPEEGESGILLLPAGDELLAVIISHPDGLDAAMEDAEGLLATLEASD